MRKKEVPDGGKPLRGVQLLVAQSGNTREKKKSRAWCKKRLPAPHFIRFFLCAILRAAPSNVNAWKKPESGEDALMSVIGAQYVRNLITALSSNILLYTYLMQSSKSDGISLVITLSSSENHGLKLENRFFLPFLFLR